MRKDLDSSDIHIFCRAFNRKTNKIFILYLFNSVRIFKDSTLIEIYVQYVPVEMC